MKPHPIVKRSAFIPVPLRLALSALLLPGCRSPHAERQATAWITTQLPLTLLSANDGQAHLKLDPGHLTSHVPMKLDRNFTRDSITVVQLGTDHPPIVGAMGSRLNR